MTSKITIIPVPVDERNIQKSRIEQNILPRSTMNVNSSYRFAFLCTLDGITAAMPGFCVEPTKTEQTMEGIGVAAVNTPLNEEK